MEAHLDPIFQGQVDSKKVPGAATVALDAKGNVLFSKGYGNTTAFDDSSPKVTPDTPMLIWSLTKLVTSVAGLQLVEQGKINLNDPASKYVPDIKKIQLLKGWNEDGSPQLAPPEKEILVLHLFTHTSGLAYDFFDQDTMKWRISQGQPPVSYVTRSAMEEYTNPLIFEPGTKWNYGPNLEWLGFIIHKVTGLRLDEYIDKNIAKPLGLNVLGLGLSAENEKNFFTVHATDPSGAIQPTPMKMTTEGEVVAPGGHFLYGSTNDYAQFLLALLNNGTHPKSGATILKPETVKKYLFTDMLPEVGCSGVGPGPGVMPTTTEQVALPGEWLPGLNRGYSLGGMINNDAAPNGRNKGSLTWVGLGNCYFWVDPTAGKLGYVASSLLPFFHKDVLHLADALERAVYEKPMAKEIGEKGSNFSGGSFTA